MRQWGTTALSHQDTILQYYKLLIINYKINQKDKSSLFQLYSLSRLLNSVHVVFLIDIFIFNFNFILIFNFIILKEKSESYMRQYRFISSRYHPAILQITNY
jgi:hypothetical protein